MSASAAPILDKLFVYGTLLKDAEHLMSTYLMERSTFLGKGSMPGRLFKVNFFPGAIHEEEESHRVHGEVYHLLEPEKVIEVLDGYEGFEADNLEESLFIRKELDIQMEDQVLRCMVYLYNQSPEGFPFIASGDFLAYEFQQM